MPDDCEQGAAPVQDAAPTNATPVDEPATQRDETATEPTRAVIRRHPLTAAELAAIEAGGEAVEGPDELMIEGPNSA